MSEAFPIRVNIFVRSNDPRDGHRGAYQIQSITNGIATLVRSSSDWTRVSLKRIYTDDKPRRSGWSVVKDAAQKAA